MINHRCYKNERDPSTGPNSEVRVGKLTGMTPWMDTGHITIRARRNIAKGEEITISYNKGRYGFDCRCATCRRKPFSGCRMM